MFKSPDDHKRGKWMEHEWTFAHMWSSPCQFKNLSVVAVVVYLLLFYCENFWRIAQKYVCVYCVLYLGLYHFNESGYSQTSLINKVFYSLVHGLDVIVMDWMLFVRHTIRCEHCEHWTLSCVTPCVLFFWNAGTSGYRTHSTFSTTYIRLLSQSVTGLLDPCLFAVWILLPLHNWLFGGAVYIDKIWNQILVHGLKFK